MREVLEQLAPERGEIVVDATFGAGGHSAAIQKAAKVRLITIDADPAAGAGIVANFADISEVLLRLGIKKIDKVLFDLGWRREQLVSGRGFSLLHDEPLSMSYGPAPRSGFTAAEIVNTWKESAIADALFGYGEERYARRIARAIAERRAIAPIGTTLELVELVRDAVPAAYRHRPLNPATKTFQALRIAVNDEIGVIEKGLRAAWRALACGGRIVVISFHSVEDRLVKNLFREFVKDEGALLVKKPIVPGRTEVRENPSARSAKLRTIEKKCQRP